MLILILASTTAGMCCSSPQEVYACISAVSIPRESFAVLIPTTPQIRPQLDEDFHSPKNPATSTSSGAPRRKRSSLFPLFFFSFRSPRAGFFLFCFLAQILLSRAMRGEDNDRARDNGAADSNIERHRERRQICLINNL